MTSSVAAAYQATKGGAFDVDRAFYDRFAGTAHELVDSFEIPIRSGRAWTVPQGHLCRIVTVEGPQVGDLNVTSPPTTASGPICPSCGRCSLSPATDSPGTAWTPRAAVCTTCWAPAATRTSIGC